VGDQSLCWLGRTPGLSLEILEPSLRRCGLYIISLLEIVCETLSNMNNPARDEPVHQNIVAKILEDIDQGTPSQGDDSCIFHFFQNIEAPLITTLNIPRLNVGLSVWLWTTLNVSKDPDASHISTLFQGHRIDDDHLPSSSNKHMLEHQVLMVHHNSSRISQLIG
jgi:hypothetical protein